MGLDGSDELAERTVVGRLRRQPASCGCETCEVSEISQRSTGGRGFPRGRRGSAGGDEELKGSVDAVGGCVAFEEAGNLGSG